MADNVAITAGAGTNIATDDAGSAHYQKVKLVDGTADSTTVIPGSANGLSVVVRDEAGKELDFRSENENWSASDHGILVFGRDTESVTNKYRALNLNAEGDLHCDLSDINGVEPDVSNGTVGNGTLRVSVASDSTGQVGAYGKLAHDAAITEATANHAPVRIGAKSLNGPAAVTDVSADADAVSLLATRGGILYVNNAHPNFWTAQVTDHNTAQTAHELKAAPGAGLSLYVTDIIISNGATAGTVKLLDATPADVFGPVLLGVYGGVAISLKTPIKCAANKALQFTSVSVTTHSVIVCGFTAP